MRSVSYFDDDLVGAQELAEDLSDTDIVVRIYAPTQELSLPAEGADGFLVDYVLSTAVTYQGGTLASAIREQGRDLPIVLVTRRNQVEGRTELELLDELPHFDAVMFKGDVHEDPTGSRARLRALIEGFERLRVAEKTVDGLLGILSPQTDHDRDLLLALSPPLTGGAWRTINVSRWLEQTVLRYPGVLIDALTAACTLGVAEGAFRTSPMSDYFSPSRYFGPLAPVDGRWWRSRLLELGSETTLSTRPGPLYLEFPEAFERTHGAVARSLCVDGCGEVADAVCYVLKKPVRSAHSLLYFPDRRPRALDAARVSFKAIRTDNRVRLELIDPAAQDVVKRLISEDTDA